ncbi:MAG TPA: hypothetical protein VNO30_33775 [Kofleriaceae bacterium]|nr:hypothetical protein [Kofleriaceae bacterium]
MSTPKDPFASIDLNALEKVAGGVSRTTGGSSDQVTAMLTQITSSIKDLASQKNSGSDPMQMMLIMLMMGGMGGGGGGVVAAPAGAATPVINVDSSVMGGGCRPRGKKGW